MPPKTKTPAPAKTAAKAAPEKKKAAPAKAVAKKADTKAVEKVSVSLKDVSVSRW